MGKRLVFLLLLFFNFSFAELHAGWYQCYNYTGKIGDYPVTFSIQITPGFFGEKEKQHFNINGVYQYEKYNNPIALEGVIDFETGKGTLYEKTGNDYTASFFINFDEALCSGTWIDSKTKKSLPFQLTKISMLTDTTSSNSFGNIDITQTSSLQHYYFVGVYKKVAGADRAEMEQLKIIHKRSNRLFQTINFKSVLSQTGNVSTIIFDNVTVTDSKNRSFIVSNNVGRAGGYMQVRFDLKKNKFILNPEPIMEGWQ